MVYSVFKSVPSFSKTFYLYVPYPPNEVLPNALVLSCTDRSSMSSLYGVMGLLDGSVILSGNGMTAIVV